MSAVDKFGRQLGSDGAPAMGLPGLPGKDGKDGVGFITDKDGNFSAGSKRFKNVRDPEDKQDAATKGWIEKFFVSLKNHASFGFKRLSEVAEPAQPNDAATKKWVEERIQALRLDCETVASGTHESLEGKIKIVESEIAHIKKLMEATAAKGSNTGTPSNRPVTSSPTKKP